MASSGVSLLSPSSFEPSSSVWLPSTQCRPGYETQNDDQSALNMPPLALYSAAEPATAATTARDDHNAAIPRRFACRPPLLVAVLAPVGGTDGTATASSARLPVRGDASCGSILPTESIKSTPPRLGRYSWPSPWSPVEGCARGRRGSASSACRLVGNAIGNPNPLRRQLLGCQWTALPRPRRADCRAVCGSLSHVVSLCTVISTAR